MAEQIPDEYLSNYEQFRDIFSSLLIEKLTAPTTKPSAKAKRRSKKSSSASSIAPPLSPSSQQQQAEENDVQASSEDLSEFTTYLSTSTFLSLPPALKSLSHRSLSSSTLLELYTPPLSPDTVSSLLAPLPPDILDSLTTYIPSLSSSSSPDTFFNSLLTSYIQQCLTPPPPPSSTRGKVTCCEICQRDWINLTYHHLIPRMVHEKAVKRKWHAREDLQNVAWLCGACHRFVHQFRGHEELARSYYTVEKLLEADEVREFAAWVGRLRWKKR
ncbi:hypothetical protein QBC43DRAFT_325935 [Cladorrhinum sp. PSN259]|nr:hypothetical protein QBC43DRAFT_325935 [Cladorrhinum sp. PSN259]